MKVWETFLKKKIYTNKGDTSIFWGKLLPTEIYEKTFFSKFRKKRKWIKMWNR